MKYLYAFAGLCLVLSCSKQIDKNDLTQVALTEKDNFIIPQSSPNVFRHNTTSGQPSSPTTPATYLVYLDFDGAIVNSPYWNNGHTLTCAAAGLTEQQDTDVINIARDLYERYNVRFTVNPSEYENYNPSTRQRIIITATSSWYPGVSGVSQIGSISWGNNTPSFVFSNVLSYNSSFVGEIVAHELGHACGLSHQMDYNSSCGQTGYHQGAIMGYPFVSSPLWITGTTSSCTTYQNDDAMLSAKLGLK